MARELPAVKVTLTSIPAGGVGAITKRTPAAGSLNVRAGIARISKSWAGSAELCVFIPGEQEGGGRVWDSR